MQTPSVQRLWSAVPDVLILVSIGLAVTAWQGDGVDGGPLLGLSRSTLFSIVATAGTALSGVVLLRDSRFPRPVRVFLAFCAAYGTAAFALGVVQRVSFRSLLAGESLWRVLPLLLQGAVVGGLIAIPVALVALVARAGIRQQHGVLRTVRKGAALATSLAIVVAALPIRGSRAAHADVSAGGATSASEPGESQTATADNPWSDPDAVITRAQQRLDRFPAVQWDVDAKAAELGPDVETLFAYVRDDIAYEPYAGVLRGASGAYTSRAGNAVDRALLLARLLANHSVRTRFVVGTLTDAQRATLIGRVFTRTPSVSLNSMPATTGGSFHERLFRRAQRDYNAVRAAIGDRLPPVTTPTREQVLAEMNPHVWIQAEVAGKWIDLDPSFTDARVGQVTGIPRQTSDELPADLYQRVTIRIVADRLRGDELASSTPLEVTRNTVDILDKQVGLTHTRPAAATGLGGAIAGALGRPVQEAWSPVLWIDGQSSDGSPVDIDGSFVTEWLEIELSWPNGRRELTRRPLVDRAGAAWRAARPLDPEQLKPLARGDNGAFAFQALHNVWFSGGRHNMADFADAAWTLTVNALDEHVTELERDPSIPPTTQSAGFGEVLWPFALPNFAWMVWTDHVVVPSLNDHAGVRLYADGPRISVFSTGSGGDNRTMVFADLRRDDLRGLAEHAADAAVLAEKKLWFGLLQGALEHEAISEQVVVAGGDPSQVTSTSSGFAGEQVTVLTPDSAARIGEIANPEAAALLRTALDNGHLVAASAGNLQRGFWWEIVQGSGETRAIGTLGLHSVDGRYDMRPGPLKNAGGSGKAYGTEEYYKELERAKAAKKRAEIAKRAAEDAEKFRRNAPPQGGKPPNGLGAPPQRGAGGGELGEYAMTLIAAVIQAVAYHFLSQMLLERLFHEIELVVDWLEKGGFRTAL